MDYLDILKNNKDIFFNFMEAKYPLYKDSNIFLRDLLYAIKNFFEKKNSELSYSTAENLALAFAAYLEANGEFTKLRFDTWRVNFSTEKVVKEEAA